MCSVCIGAGDVGPVPNGTLFPVVDYFGQGKRVPFEKQYDRGRENMLSRKIGVLFISVFKNVQSL